MRRMSKAVAREAAEHLSAADKVLRPVIQMRGLCTIRPHRDYYQALVREIIGQQLHVKAAAAIAGRFTELFDGAFPPAETILTKNVDQLRAVGLSRAKAAYILDLARHVDDGNVQFDHLDDLANDEVIAELTAVKGIGTWTAHMFLMFCMGRPDILPVGDLGLQNGIRKLYGLADRPTAEQITKLATSKRWHPYESVASWYIWQALDNQPAL